MNETATTTQQPQEATMPVSPRCEAADSYGSCGPATFTEINSTKFVGCIITRSACAAHVNITSGWRASIVGRATRNHPVSL